jgi:hypothetical protein
VDLSLVNGLLLLVVVAVDLMLRVVAVAVE